MASTAALESGLVRSTPLISAPHAADNGVTSMSATSCMGQFPPRPRRWLFFCHDNASPPAVIPPGRHVLRFKSPPSRAAMGRIRHGAVRFRTSGIMMRHHTVIASALLLLAGAAARPALADTEVTFGVTSATGFNLAHFVAIEKKYYETEKLKVDMIVAGAAVGVLQQLAAGSLNMA